MHWFPKHNKSMGTFRIDVKKHLEGSSNITMPNKNTPDTWAKKDWGWARRLDRWHKAKG